MPVRLLSSSVLKWPDKKEVEGALRRWSEDIIRNKPEVICIGYFGSYARGEWGVGSDIDIVAIVEKTHEPFWKRPIHWDLLSLPVPADILIYTPEEWKRLKGKFKKIIKREVKWIYKKGQADGERVFQLAVNKNKYK